MSRVVKGCYRDPPSRYGTRRRNACQSIHNLDLSPPRTYRSSHPLAIFRHPLNLSNPPRYLRIRVAAKRLFHHRHSTYPRGLLLSPGSEKGNSRTWSHERRDHLHHGKRGTQRNRIRKGANQDEVLATCILLRYAPCEFFSKEVDFSEKRCDVAVVG